jgi:hypothetical protein
MTVIPEMASRTSSLLIVAMVIFSLRIGFGRIGFGRNVGLYEWFELGEAA